jgi:DNA-directed RNA polymerase subunit RPC12/RpoP
MHSAFNGSALVYYVCGGCGLSKMDVQPPPTMPEPQPKPTGLVCLQCNKPFATIESESEDGFDCHCPNCGHRWSVPTIQQKPN